MKKFGYLFGWAIVLMSAFCFAADDEEGKKKVPFIVTRIVNTGANNDVEVFLKECFNPKSGRYDVVREFTLAAPKRKIFEPNTPGQEEFIQWLISEEQCEANMRSRAITHHSTVYPYRKGNAVYLVRRKKSESEREECVEFSAERLKAVSVLRLMWSISTNGQHTFNEVNPEGGSTIIPGDTIEGGGPDYALKQGEPPRYSAPCPPQLGVPVAVQLVPYQHPTAPRSPYEK